MTLDAVEFIRRFLPHILPRGFVRIRQFGFLANRGRRKKLALCRILPGAPAAPARAVVAEDRNVERHVKRCPICKTGYMVAIGIVHALFQVVPSTRLDSS